SSCKAQGGFVVVYEERESRRCPHERTVRDARCGLLPDLLPHRHFHIPPQPGLPHALALTSARSRPIPGPAASVAGPFYCRIVDQSAEDQCRPGHNRPAAQVCSVRIHPVLDVHPAVARQLARHATMSTTMNIYTSVENG